MTRDALIRTLKEDLKVKVPRLSSPKSDRRPSYMPHQEIFTQTILILKSHTEMIIRAQDHIPHIVSHNLPTKINTTTMRVQNK
jgi:hypothetical protein